jgi:hypothetical protein
MPEAQYFYFSHPCTPVQEPAPACLDLLDRRKGRRRARRRQEHYLIIKVHYEWRVNLLVDEMGDEKSPGGA